MIEDLSAGAQSELRAVVIFAGDKARLQVRLGDLYHNTPFTAPSILMGENLNWRKGELRKALDQTVLYMCEQIIKHKSMFKCRESCTRNTPMMKPCPCAEEEP